MKFARLVTMLGRALLLGIAVAEAAEVTPLAGSWRYKMTVEVETPEGLKTGSAVREVFFRIHLL
jgi:hypothetical protein